jgi:hypothetical protein
MAKSPGSQNSAIQRLFLPEHRIEADTIPQKNDRQIDGRGIYLVLTRQIMYRGIENVTYLPEVHSYQPVLMNQDPEFLSIFGEEQSLLDRIRDGVVAEDTEALVRLTPEIWDGFSISDLPDSGEFILSNKGSRKPSPVPYSQALERLSMYNILIESGNLVLAGGAVFSCLFGLAVNDIDLFFVTPDQIEAQSLIVDFIDKHKKWIPYVSRTAGSISVTVGRYQGCKSPTGITGEIQYILRLYHNISEVLHGFDVDCCCMGYDGTDIWITRRCYYALTRGYNSVNMNRLSPSYEYRLIKYALRGIPVYVPGFDRSKVNVELLQAEYTLPNPLSEDEFYGDYDKMCEFFDTIKEIRSKTKKLRGFDLLILADHRRRADATASVTDGRLGILREERQTNSLMTSIKVSDYAIDAEDRNVPSWIPIPYSISIMAQDKYTVDNNPPMPKFDFVFEELEKYYHISTPALKVNQVRLKSKFHQVFHLPVDLHDVMEATGRPVISRTVQFKKLNPGEQATGSFHKIVLEDPRTWFFGRFYFTH